MGLEYRLGGVSNDVGSELMPADVLPLDVRGLLFDSERRFEDGRVMELGAIDMGAPAVEPALRTLRVGRWECALSSNALTWSDPVHDIFGLPRGICPVRATAVALYAEGSRVIMERLRAHAIEHGRGFVLDAELRPNDGGRRWMRLIAAPVYDGGLVVRLHGLKKAF